MQSGAFGDIITKMTINEFLAEYAPVWRGHTPGHKGKLDPRDITEVPDVFPADLIEQAEARAAKLYGVRALRFLVGGSSIGIKAAVLATGAKSLVTDIYRHRAVDEAAFLAGATVTYADSVSGEDGLPVMTTPEDFERAIRKSGATVAVVQYPDYYGRAPDLKKTAEAVRSAGAMLIVDSAHGAHFALRPDLFPLGAAGLADACNMSAHKTLGAMTQTAFLALSPALTERANVMLDALGTTSPNYVLYASLESCVNGAAECAREYDRLKAFSDGLRKRHRCLNSDDFTRVVLDCGAHGGRRAAHEFYARGIAAEKYDDRYVVFILTPFDGDEELAAFSDAADEVLG